MNKKTLAVIRDGMLSNRLAIQDRRLPETSRAARVNAQIRRSWQRAGDAVRSAYESCK